jgi:hypothetical protein
MNYLQATWASLNSICLGRDDLSTELERPTHGMMSNSPTALSISNRHI